MDRSPLHSFITSVSLQVTSQVGRSWSNQENHCRLGRSGKMSQKRWGFGGNVQKSWRGDGRWNFGDEWWQYETQALFNWDWIGIDEGNPYKYLDGIFSEWIFSQVCLSLSIGMSNLPDPLQIHFIQIFSPWEGGDFDRIAKQRKVNKLILIRRTGKFLFCECLPVFSQQLAWWSQLRIFAFGTLSKKSMNFQEIETYPTKGAAIIAVGFQLCQEAKLPARHRVPRPFSVVEGDSWAQGWEWVNAVHLKWFEVNIRTATLFCFSVSFPCVFFEATSVCLRNISDIHVHLWVVLSGLAYHEICKQQSGSAPGVELGSMSQLTAGWRDDNAIIKYEVKKTLLFKEKRSRLKTLSVRNTFPEQEVRGEGQWASAGLEEPYIPEIEGSIFGWFLVSNFWDNLSTSFPDFCIQSKDFLKRLRCRRFRAIPCFSERDWVTKIGTYRFENMSYLGAIWETKDQVYWKLTQ